VIYATADEAVAYVLQAFFSVSDVYKKHSFVFRSTSIQYCTLSTIIHYMQINNSDVKHQNLKPAPKVSCSLRENVGGSEKSRLVCGVADDWFKRVLHGYDEPAGCPWA